MEYLLFVFFLALAVRIFLQLRKQSQNLPPSPLAFPIIGHLHLLKQPIHRSFHKLSQKYGPIMSLKLGSQLVVVISSPSLAEECLSTHDVVLANRPISALPKYLQYNCTTMGATNYGDRWRMLRRVSNSKVFSQASLNSSSDIRRDEVRELLLRLYSTSSHSFSEVTLRTLLMDLTFNIITRTVAGKRYCGVDMSEGDEEGRLLMEMVEEQFELGSSPNPGDLFPILRLVDYNGYEKKLAESGKKMDEKLQNIVEEHRVKRGQNDVVSRLLTLQETQPECYTDETIKGLILALFGLAFGERLRLKKINSSKKWCLFQRLVELFMLKKLKSSQQLQNGAVGNPTAALAATNPNRALDVYKKSGRERKFLENFYKN